MSKRKRSRSRAAIQLRTGAPLLYGAKRSLPRPQERVPRSIFSRPLMPRRKRGMTTNYSVLPIAVARVLRVASARRIVSKRAVDRPAFRFQSPFARQYAAMKSVGSMVKNPKRVGFCLKRKLRREVLFAFKLAGYSGSGPGRRNEYRRNDDSLHGC